MDHVYQLIQRLQELKLSATMEWEKSATREDAKYYQGLETGLDSAINVIFELYKIK